MAKRPVFVSQDAFPFVVNVETEFKFHSGFAISQYHKSIKSLHECFLSVYPEYNETTLEVSSKSQNPLGVRLSAFNLIYTTESGNRIYVENAFQSSKCFADGNQYLEILEMSANEAKRFPGLRTSGNVIKFRFEDKDYPIEPKTFFYDWIYINALHQNKNLAEEVIKYRVFTDIAFNPANSINCQARSVALYVGLYRAGKIDDAIASSDQFLKIVYNKMEKMSTYQAASQQLSMF